MWARVSWPAPRSCSCFFSTLCRAEQKGCCQKEEGCPVRRGCGFICSTVQAQTEEERPRLCCHSG